MRPHPIYRTGRWRRLSSFVRFVLALGYCEHCGVAHGALTPDDRDLVQLQCAHLNGDPTDFRLENLRALCRECHFVFDQIRRVRDMARSCPELKLLFAQPPCRRQRVRRRRDRKRRRRQNP